MLLDIFLKKKEPSKNAKGHHEITMRSFLKTLSWRIVGTLDTILIAYLITGKVEQALSIGFVEWGTKMIVYFFHERAWNRISWGKK